MATINQLHTSQSATNIQKKAHIEPNEQPIHHSAQTSPLQKDAVSLSHHSKGVDQLRQQLATTTPSFDHNKVAAIKAAIANGSYSVNPERLADNIIKFEDEGSHLKR